MADAHVSACGWARAITSTGLLLEAAESDIERSAVTVIALSGLGLRIWLAQNFVRFASHDTGAVGADPYTSPRYNPSK
jgi:hypothetical protein